MNTIHEYSQEFFATLRQPGLTSAQFEQNLQVFQSHLASALAEGGPTSKAELYQLLAELEKVMAEPGQEIVARGYIPVDIVEQVAEGSKEAKIALLREPYTRLKRVVAMLQGLAQ